MPTLKIVLLLVLLTIPSALHAENIPLPSLCLRYDFCNRQKAAVDAAAIRCGSDTYCRERIVGLERYGIFVLLSPDEGAVPKYHALTQWGVARIYLNEIDRKRITNNFWGVLSSGTQAQIYDEACRTIELVIKAINRIDPNETRP